MTTLGEIAKIVNGSIVGNKEVEINGVSTLDNSIAGTITFIYNGKYAKYLDNTKASAIIANNKDLITNKNGIIVCISYHSLEDKIVKNFFNEITTFCICEPSIPICKCGIKQQFKYPKKKKFMPSDKEKEINPRSKSAIMRYVIKL